MLRLFDCLETEPNVLFRDSYREGGRSLSASEQALLRQYRGLSLKGRETVRSVVDALCAYRDEVEETGPEKQEPRVIPLYRNPAAAGYASPVFGEDFDYIPVTEDVPQAAEFAVRISGDSMAPYIADGSVVYVNRDPLREGDVGIFCVDGDLFCKQYYKDPAPLRQPGPCVLRPGHSAPAAPAGPGLILIAQKRNAASAAFLFCLFSPHLL